MKNVAQDKLKAGKNVVGTFFESGSAANIEILGLSKLDYLIIDMEHSPYSIDQVTDFVRAAELREIAPFVRIKNTLRSTVLNVLDIGARGLIIPAIKTVEEVKSVIEYAKYYPMGQRGAYFPRAYDFGMRDQPQDVLNHFKNVNDNTLIIPQCETKESLECIEDIVALEGVDGIFIGPYDLSIALGKPAAFTDEVVINAFDKVLSACKKYNKHCFIYAPNATAANNYFSKGYRGVCVSADTIELGNSYTRILSEIK